METARQITQMQYLIFGLYYRIEEQRTEIERMKNEIRYLTNYNNFLVVTSNDHKQKYQQLSREYYQLYQLFVRQM
jgi:hypothetical protein